VPALVAAVLLAAAGCGGGGDGDTEGGAGTTGQTARVSGETVFKGNCAGCHTLHAAGANGSVGPNLDDLKPDHDTVQHQVENGGGGMPAFEGQLSAAEIDAVATYVADNAGS
jgi:mono/diheme cytochrome c family protein